MPAPQTRMSAVDNGAQLARKSPHIFGEYGNFSTDGVWVEADSAITTNVGSETQTLDVLGFEGFGYFENGVNPRQSTNPINTLITGTTDGMTVAYKLQDSTQNFLDTVSLGDTVNNLSEGGSTTISAIESNTSLALAG